MALVEQLRRTLDADVPANSLKSKISLSIAAMLLGSTEAVFLGSELAKSPGRQLTYDQWLTYLPTLQLVLALLLVWLNIKATIFFAVVGLATSLVTGHFLLVSMILPLLVLITMLYLRRNLVLGYLAGFLTWLVSLPLFFPADALLLLFLVPASLVGGVMGWSLRNHRVKERAVEVERHLALMEADRIVSGVKRSMARDLHDILAHNLAIISLQTEAQRYATSAEASAELVATVNRVAKQTLADMRTLLTLLYVGASEANTRGSEVTGQSGGLSQSDDWWAPDGTGVLRIEDGLDQIKQTLESLGYCTTLRCRGGETSDIPAAQSTALYRLMQEAVTNILKHAPERAVCTFTLDVHASRVRFIVENELSSAPDEAGDEGVAGRSRPRHYGLLNMQERVKAFGGTIEIGPHDGLWRIEAILPFVGSR